MSGTSFTYSGSKGFDRLAAKMQFIRKFERTSPFVFQRRRGSFLFQRFHCPVKNQSHGVITFDLDP